MAGGCSTVRAQYSGVWFEHNTMVVGSDHPIFLIQALKGTFWSWMSSCMVVTDEVLRGKKKEGELCLWNVLDWGSGMVGKKKKKVCGYVCGGEKKREKKREKKCYHNIFTINLKVGYY